MTDILVEKNPSPMKLDVLQVDEWQVLETGVSKFDRQYDQSETFYVEKGELEILVQGAESVTISADDLVVLMPGLRCTWDVKQPTTLRFKPG